MDDYIFRTLYIPLSEFKKARDWVEKEMKLDNKRDVNLFEITIRGVGGLLSAYHLTKDNIFKEKAVSDWLFPCVIKDGKTIFSHSSQSILIS